MKYLFVLMILFVAVLNGKAITNDCANKVDLSSEKEARYVVVYKVNGVTHAVIVNHYVNCQFLADWVDEHMPNISILDCGPVGDVSVPTGTQYVNEATALSELGLDEWPQ